MTAITQSAQPAIPAAGPGGGPQGAPVSGLPDGPGSGRRAPAALLGASARWLNRNWLLVLAVAIFGLAVLWALVPGLFTSFDPIAIDNRQKLLPPSAEHWFGTDFLGRDLYARIVYGARASLIGAALAVAVAVVVGALVGTAAGWFGGWVDTLSMRGIDVILSIPGFLLAIAIVVLYTASFGKPGLIPAALAVGLTSSATFARLIRAEVLRVRTSNYVEAAITSGAVTSTILRRHVIPNALGPTVSLVAVQLGIAIIWIASLSYLGLGAQPPAPEWGLLVSDGSQFIATRGWLTLYPAVAITAVVLATNYLSRRLSQRNSR